MKIFFNTDIGTPTKDINQDSAAVIHGAPGADTAPSVLSTLSEINTDAERIVACVTDGISSSPASEKMSQHAADSFVRGWWHADDPFEQARTNVLLEQVNEDVRQFYFQRFHDVGGTTLSAVCIENGNTLCAVNLGDSPIYCIRNYELIPLFQCHAQGNMLEHFIGSPYDAPGDVVTPTHFALCPDDIILLASDGITNALAPQEIIETLTDKTTDNKAAALLSRALVHATDNLTVIVITEFPHKAAISPTEPCIVWSSEPNAPQTKSSAEWQQALAELIAQQEEG